MTQTLAEPARKLWVSRNPNDWVPFEWDEPLYGRQVFGEIAIARANGATGSHMAGFWRCHAGAPGARNDGSSLLTYSAPLGDEALVVVEGEATVTVVATGEQHLLTPGTIMCHPKNLELTWDIKGPYFKKYWVIWDSPKEATPSEELVIFNTNANPENWEPYSWTEPVEGEFTDGEIYIIKGTGSTGTYMCGLWRAGVGIAGCEPDGSKTIAYTSVYGDETEFLLEGSVHVRNDETGEEFDAHAGDVIGFFPGVHVTWTQNPPFIKKFWVITNEELPAEA
jgi:uncharacterized cupin superfamily protein